MRALSRGPLMNPAFQRVSRWGGTQTQGGGGAAGAAERDEGVVARAADESRLPAGFQVGSHGVAGGSGRSERGRGDERPVMREVLAQQVHALPGAGEDGLIFNTYPK